MHSGPQGKSEPCVQREPTERVIIVIVIENRNRESREETEKRRKARRNRDIPEEMRRDGDT